MTDITCGEMSSEVFRKKRWSLKIRGYTKGREESDKEEHGNGE